MKQSMKKEQGKESPLPARSLAKLRRAMPGHSEDYYQTVARMVDGIAAFISHPETSPKAAAIWEEFGRVMRAAISKAKARKAVR